jgi:hypothetical protein
MLQLNRNPLKAGKTFGHNDVFRNQFAPATVSNGFEGKIGKSAILT